MPFEDGTLNQGETDGIMDGAADEMATLIGQMAGDTGEPPDGTDQDDAGEAPKSADQDQAGDQPQPDSPKEGAAEKDPELEAARTTAKEVDALLKEHGFTNLDDLKEAVKRGSEDVLDGEDPEQLLKDAREMRERRQREADEAEQRRAENETPEETIERQARELSELKAQVTERAEADRAIEENRKIIQRYEKSVGDLVDAMKIDSKYERDLTKQLLGVGNPMDEVDITDRKAVADALRSQIPQIRKLIDNIQQAAIDAYASGKSSRTPSKKAAPAGNQEPAQKGQADKSTSQKLSQEGVVTDIAAESEALKEVFSAELMRELGITSVHQ